MNRNLTTNRRLVPTVNVANGVFPRVFFTQPPLGYSWEFAPTIGVTIEGNGELVPITIGELAITVFRNGIPIARDAETRDIPGTSIQNHSLAINLPQNIVVHPGETMAVELGWNESLNPDPATAGFLAIRRIQINAQVMQTESNPITA